MVSTRTSTAIALAFFAALTLGFTAPSPRVLVAPTASLFDSDAGAGTATFEFTGVPAGGLLGTIVITAGGVTTTYSFDVLPGDKFTITLPPGAMGDKDAGWSVNSESDGDVGYGDLW